MEAEQRVVIAADALGQGLSRSGVVEHAAGGHTVGARTLNGKTDDAAGEHFHDRQRPVRAQQSRFAAEQVDTPEAVLGLSGECRQGFAIGAGLAWPIVLRERSANDILVNCYVEGM